MNKYDYYDSLKKYKKNYLQHAKSKLYGIQQDDHQYYKRIGEPGNYRYFYSKDQWDAYQKERAGMTGYEDWKKNQDAKETAKEKANMTGYDSWKKEEDKKKETERIKEEGKKNLEKKLAENKETTATASPTNLTDAKAQAERIDNKNRINSIQEKLNEIFNSNDNEYTIISKIADEISQTKEGREIINEFVTFLDDHNGKYEQTRLLKPLENGREKLTSTFDLNNEDINKFLKEDDALSKLDVLHYQMKPWKEGQDKPTRDAADVYNQVLDELFDKAVEGYKRMSKRSRVEKEYQKKALEERYKDLYHVANIAVNYENNTDIDECYDILKEWRSHEDIDPETGLPLKNYSLTIKQDLRLVNPGYFYEENSRDGNNMTEDEVTGYHHNCLLSTIACVLRERGYDVSAGTDLDGVRAWGPSFLNEYDNIYPNIETSIGDLSSIKDLRQEMEQLPAGSYGDMQVVWNFFKGTNVSGHSVFFKVDNGGKLHIYDGQTGQEEQWEHYEEYALTGRYYVLNDAEIDIEYIKENKMIIY